MSILGSMFVEFRQAGAELHFPGDQPCQSDCPRCSQTISKPTAEDAETEEGKYFSSNFSANSARSAVLE